MHQFDFLMHELDHLILLYACMCTSSILIQQKHKIAHIILTLGFSTSAKQLENGASNGLVRHESFEKQSKVPARQLLRAGMFMNLFTLQLVINRMCKDHFNSTFYYILIDC
jgi:hypothetical protein